MSDIYARGLVGDTARITVAAGPFDEYMPALSTGGGLAPAWAHSGRELFYVNRADSLIAVEVSGKPDFQAGARRALFSTSPYVIQPLHRSYEVAPDDRSFIMQQRSGATGAEANRLTVVLNWFGEARAKMLAR